MVTLVPATFQAITRNKKQEDPFIFSPDLIERLQLLEFARKVIALAFRPCPCVCLAAADGLTFIPMKSFW
ncbi:MAG: hypothetical protein ACP5RC_12405 [Halothiobacillaceae bacterium]